MDPQISIIVPTYNRPAKLARALESCTQQTVAPQEVLVVDNGQNPQTPEVVEAHARDAGFPIRHLQSKPFDIRIALATGIEAVRSDWLILLDDDDFLVPDRIEADQTALAQLDDAVIVLMHDFIRVDYTHATTWWHTADPARLDLRHALTLDGFPPPPAGTWRSAVIQAKHPYRHARDMNTDYDLYAACMAHGRASALGQVGYVMDDTRCQGRLTTDFNHILAAVNRHREVYRPLHASADGGADAINRRLDQQAAFYAGKYRGVRAFAGAHGGYARKYPLEALKGIAAPARNFASRLLGPVLPEMRGSRSYSLDKLRGMDRPLAEYIERRAITEPSS